MISVVMCIYNEPEEWLKDSIESILNQTFTNLEFIIVNDNPERTINGSIVRHYMDIDSRIQLIENAENFGLTCSLNIAFRNTSGTYIARMDGDDISLPKRLETQFKYMETHPEIGVCGCWAKLFGNIHLTTQRLYKVPIASSQIQIALPFYNPIIHPSAFFRKSAIAQYNPLYDEKYRNAQDYLLWEKLLNDHISLANIEMVLLKYRVSKNQISSAMKQSQNSVASLIRLRSLENLGMQLSDAEKSLMIKIANREPFAKPTQLAEAEALLLRTKAFLTHLDLTKDSIVDRTLHLEWLHCYLNYAFRRKTIFQFLRSPLFQTRFLNLYSFVKILI